ncbi:MAG TPA: anthranilate synthase component I [Bryobacteraceae bacterium]|nr:anthranilate synthase component I [Bryobacteraceae bacterium]
MSQLKYSTRSGIRVVRTASALPFERGLHDLLRELDQHRGIYLSSGYEYPGRYSRWDIAAVRPPLEIVGFGREMRFSALNDRGVVLNRMLRPILEQHPHWDEFHTEGDHIIARLKPLPTLFSEEERSKQPSAFSILRELVEEFRNERDNRLALFGAFGYDLLFQFDPIELRLPRTNGRDLHLYLCDDVWYMDRRKERIERFEYDFSFADLSTEGLSRAGVTVEYRVGEPRAPGIVSDHQPAEYMANVETVREGMREGAYYEVVLRQTFSSPFEGSPSDLFDQVQNASPSPYEFFLQLGDQQLIGASPEMFVRVEGTRVETCPISGTARRSGDPIQDAANIRALLNSDKEESELTMCTDVDRNDKSRVCVPGSVKVIGRRLIEAYAGLFHTVDHVEGTLEPGFDSLDAFLANMWAVTVIGAPKKAAAQAIEQIEKTARGWYGGAVGMLALNGDINTGILIRTVHLRDGLAEYPAGATLLYDSVPELEEQETRLKATSFFRALEGPPSAAPEVQPGRKSGSIRLLLVDNEDCFIHTLSNYARQTGAEVVTYRAGFPLELIDQLAPDVILVSPGPGRPSDFGVAALVLHAAERRIPLFGVCLGLQGVVEAFGGQLGVLPYPVHGKPSVVHHSGVGVFAGLPESVHVGRYHSLYAIRETLPPELEITAESEDGVIMGLRHRTLPIEAVQFHPESLLSLKEQCGLRIVENLVAQHKYQERNASVAK